MTMILQLLVAAVAVGLTVAATPEYKQNLTALQEAAIIRQKNLLSMEGNIPLLNDSRRHYAEIVNVIHYHGERSSGGLVPPYYEVYQRYLNTSATEAIKNPEIVINKIKDLVETVHDRTSELKDLIDACVQDDETCNIFIDDTVIQNFEQYGPQAEVFFAAGNVASELEKRNSKFEEVSKNLAAHSYVISRPQDLRDIVEAAGYLFYTLNRQRARNV